MLRRVGLVCLLFWQIHGSALAKGMPSPVTFEFTSAYVDIQIAAGGTWRDNKCEVPSRSFQISKYEVTNTEYANFLNAVARLGDPHNLYSPMQEQHFWGGIVRKKLTQTDFIYSVKAGYEKLPATYISWPDAIRYINWLHFGRPNTGRSEIGTTEGTDSVGAYDTTSKGFHRKPRNSAAKYFLPSCGEWIYSAFFNPKKASFNTYVGGDTPPQAGQSTPGQRTANYYKKQWANPFPHLTPVDTYQENASAFNTLNQAGNAMEWTETGGDTKIALGGSLFLPEDTLHLDYKDYEFFSKKLSSFGFRVARRIDVGHNSGLNFVTKVESSGFFNQKADISSNAINPLPMTWTRIEHIGNISDLRTGRGCVPYPYEISQTEITNAQYTKFLNAVAADEDTYRLYIDDMSLGVVGGIQKRKQGNISIYTVKPGYENRPATYISWFSLARYANWLHFGSPTGKQTLGVTEGTSTIGAYDTSGFQSYDQKTNRSTISHSTFTRNVGAKYFIPTDDEWYKAAYYDPEKSGWLHYWKYPNRSNTPPLNQITSLRPSNFQTETLGEGPPYYVSEARSYQSTGYYKAYDLGGNVWEWTETWRGLGDDNCWRCNIPNKGLRGGSFNYIDLGLSNGNIDPGAPGDHYFVYGGRIARQVSPSKEGWCLPPQIRYKTISTLKSASQDRIILAIATLTAAMIAILYWYRRKNIEAHVN